MSQLLCSAPESVWPPDIVAAASFRAWTRSQTQLLALISWRNYAVAQQKSGQFSKLIAGGHDQYTRLGPASAVGAAFSPRGQERKGGFLDGVG